MLKSIIFSGTVVFIANAMQASAQQGGNPAEGGGEIAETPSEFDSFELTAAKLATEFCLKWALDMTDESSVAYPGFLQPVNGSIVSGQSFMLMEELLSSDAGRDPIQLAWNENDCEVVMPQRNTNVFAGYIFDEAFSSEFGDDPDFKSWSEKEGTATHTDLSQRSEGKIAYLYLDRGGPSVVMDINGQDNTLNYYHSSADDVALHLSVVRLAPTDPILTSTLTELGKSDGR